MNSRALVVVAALGIALGIWASGCGGTCSKPGAASMGAADTHCMGMDPQPTAQSSCHPADAGMAADDGGAPDYGDTMYGNEGDDDDCKYHVKWSSSDICESTDVTFNLTVTYKGDGGAVIGASPVAEVFLNDTHPAPNSNMMATDKGGGQYTVGPIRFDASGKWTVRFHLFEDCEDLLEDSPHGHAAFYLDVP